MVRKPARPGRIPPYDEAAERALLGAMLLKSHAIAAGGALVGAEDFYRPAHGHIFDAIVALDGRGEAVDPITVAAELDRAGLAAGVDVVTLTELAGDTPATGNAASYARIVADHASWRRLIAVGSEVAEMGYSRLLDRRDALERVRALVDSLAPPPGPPPWPTLDEAAWRGPFGAYALEAAGHTEADPAGILVCALAAFGAIVGAGPHMNAGNAAHALKVYPVLVGETAKARKGSGYAAVDALLWRADGRFRKTRCLGGFNSGEAIADAFKSDDDGTPADVRLLCLEPEFGRFLAAAGRDGSTMSALTRQAWDGSSIETRARSATVVVDRHHLVMIGQITAEELRAKLGADDVTNGFANRILWCAVRRAAVLPNGGNIPIEVIEPAADAMYEAAVEARKRGQLVRDSAGDARWAEVYREIAGDDPPGVIGAVTSRGDTQTMRLAMLYALAERSRTVGAAHIDAAYAVWRYCRASAAWIWGSGDHVASRVMDALRANPGGLNGSQLHAVFDRHLAASKLNGALKALETQGLVTTTKVPTGGRPSHVYTLANERTKRTKPDEDEA